MPQKIQITNNSGTAVLLKLHDVEKNSTWQAFIENNTQRTFRSDPSTISLEAQTGSISQTVFHQGPSWLYDTKIWLGQDLKAIVETMPSDGTAIVRFLSDGRLANWSFVLVVLLLTLTLWRILRA